VKKITTVRGDIAPEQLGFTTMHEHTITGKALLGDMFKGMGDRIPPQMLRLTNENLAFLRSGTAAFSRECSTCGDVDYMVKELAAFKRVGGNAVVDASPIELRGDVNDIKKASSLAGVHIVVCTGIYIAPAQTEEFAGKDVNFIADRFRKEIEDGIDGTDIKPGFLKCAIGTLAQDGGIDEKELTGLRAAAKVAAETGMSVHVHSAIPLTGKHILQAVTVALDECGVQPDKLLMLHQDAFIRRPASIMEYVADINVVRTINIETAEKIIERGVNISFDTWTSIGTFLTDDLDRMKGLAALLKKGYADKIVLGHDVNNKAQGVSYGSTGFTGFVNTAIPQLKQLGFGDEVIKKLTVENPARILAY
jgi:phosphotriesterase-related protein